MARRVKQRLKIEAKIVRVIGWECKLVLSSPTITGVLVDA